MFTRRLLLGHGVGGVVMLSSHAVARTLTQTQTGSSRSVTSAPLPLVMLDPGHGGKDPGAIGASGTYEKNVAFAAAHELRRQLTSDGVCRVELTRMRDVFVPLDDRVAHAEERGAHLFVSMHADALPDPSVRGASIYTLAETASDAQTATLAQRENSADRFGQADFGDTPPEVARILASLVRRETRAGSARLSRSMLASLHDTVPLLTNPSRHAAFEVLKAADIPSVLVEMGFMSNVEDEAELQREEHRARVAGAVRQAIRSFLATTGRMTADLG